MQGEAKIVELSLVCGRPSAYISCDDSAVPEPGRYLLAHEAGSDAPLATGVFAAAYRSNGFVAAPPVPPAGAQGLCYMFAVRWGLDSSCRRGAASALIAWNDDPAPLLPLVGDAIGQAAAVALVCANPPPELPLQVEVHPPPAMVDVCIWSDYAAFHVERDSVDVLVRSLTQPQWPAMGGTAQALVRTEMPCGGLADCGVCTVRTNNGPQLACVEGPVLN